MTTTTTTTVDAAEEEARQIALTQLSDPLWRLSNLYYITDENGRTVLFRPNRAQRKLLRKLWNRNLILKARQQGFSTLIQLMMLDACLFTPNTQGGIILQTLEDAKALFRNKIKFAYDRLPETIKASNRLLTDSMFELQLENGSNLRCATSLRSGTFQFVHVSEMGKIARKFPDRAREIVTGTFPTVHQNGFLFVESTAEGRDGHFFRMVQEARAASERGVNLTKLDFRFHFFSWWEDRRNRLAPEGVDIPARLSRYFDDLARDHCIKTDAEQRAWYVRREAELGDDMLREYPSTPDEAFAQSVEGAIYGRSMSLLRSQGRITRVDVLPVPVNTFWDLGHNDINAIWFHQSAPMGEHRFIDYEEGFGLELEHYVKAVRSRGYLMGKWFLPHDAEHKRVAYGSARDRLVELGVPEADIVIVERCESLTNAIEQTRKMLRYAWIDAQRCEAGIKHLDNYQWKWNKATGAWLREPLHNEASNGADAIRQWAQAWEQAMPTVRKKLIRRGSAMAR